MAEFKDSIERENDFENDENEYFYEPQILMDHNTYLNNKTIEEQSEIQTFEIIKAERKNLEDLPIENDTIEPNQIKSDEITNRFQCNFCNKMYSINFHLKQHIKKVHEEIKHVSISNKGS